MGNVPDVFGVLGNSAVGGKDAAAGDVVQAHAVPFGGVGVGFHHALLRDASGFFGVESVVKMAQLAVMLPEKRLRGGFSRPGSIPPSTAAYSADVIMDFSIKINGR